MYPPPLPPHSFATPNYFLGSPKRKGGQVRFTAHQTQVLEKRFISHKYLSPEERRNLAVQLQLSDRQVKTWFQNRRAKYRRASCPDDIMRKDNRLLLDQNNLVRLRSSSPAVIGFQQQPLQQRIEQSSHSFASSSPSASAILISPSHPSYQSESSSASSDNEIDLNHLD